jgi:N,N'-diacetyllegionaminate synthase
MQATHIKIIAEMAWAHDGSLEKALKILEGAKQAGADAIGIHITCLEDYMVPHYGNGTGKVSAGKEHLEIYQYLDTINLSFDEWLRFKEEAEKKNLSLCVMPNDHKSLLFASEKLNPAYYVISAASFVEKTLIQAIAKQNKPTLFRIGGATLAEIEEAIACFQKLSGAPIALLHGFQNYPTPLENLHIRQLKTLKNLFGLPVGLADHIDGSSPLALSIPLLAVAYGAEFIEKHITFDRNEKGEDFESALDPSQFKLFVELVRAAEIALGDAHWKELSESAIRYRNISRKKIVAANHILENTLLSHEDVTFKRSDVGLTADEIGNIVGRRVNKTLNPNDAVTVEDLCP